MKFEYQAAWKELLVGTYGDHRFIVEMTMGELHVFFPLEATWEEKAPVWAKGKWKEARDHAEAWAASQKIPFEVDQGAWVKFHHKRGDSIPIRKSTWWDRFLGR